MGSDRSNVATATVSMIRFSNRFQASDRTNSFVKPIPSENHNFEYAVRPIYYFSRLFGLLSFSVVRNSIGEIHKPRVRIIDGLFFVIAICWYLALAYASSGNVTIMLENPRVSFILVFGDHLLLASGLIFGALCITMDMFNCTRLVEMLKKFNIFDRNVCCEEHPCSVVIKFSSS